MFTSIVIDFCNEFPIVALTKTWLNCSISNEELFTNNYSLYRKDHNFSKMGGSRGGGVFEAIRVMLFILHS